MQLVGMLDSPFVRRSAIALHLLGVPFEHKSVSVLTQVEEFTRINPVLKVPTLVLDDGSCLMDSNLIIDYATFLAGADAPSLLPAEPAARLEALRAIGLGLAACEKTMQIIYEHRLRPEDKRHGPWLERVRGQLLAACRQLESECATAAWMDAERIGLAGVTVAAAWMFMRLAQPQVIDTADFPLLAAWSERAEALPAFRLYPRP
jgi:glutathione S-transferase